MANEITVHCPHCGASVAVPMNVDQITPPADDKGRTPLVVSASGHGFHSCSSSQARPGAGQVTGL